MVTATAAPLEMPERMPSSLVARLFDVVDQREIEDVGHEARTDALNLARSRFERRARALLGQDRTRRGLDGDRADPWSP
jgi:hypothetical protein